MMNGIEKITEKILADAKAQSDALLAEARENAAAAVEAATTKAKADAAALLATLPAKRAEIDEKIENVCRTERRRMVAATRQAMITETFEQVKAGILALPAEDYLEFLVALVRQITAVHTEGGELLLSPADREKFGADLIRYCNTPDAAPITLAADTAKISGGVILRAGKIEWNSGLDTVIREVAEQYAFLVSDLLFAEGEGNLAEASGH